MGMTSRFVIADETVSASFKQHTIVILSDISFWAGEYDNLKEWCNNNGSIIQGMTVNIPNAETLTAFCLKWA